MRKIVQMLGSVFTVALLVGIAVPSWAVDGVILIDQNKAMAGGVTPGDMPAFPVTISLSGSYRLASNLTVPAGVDGIHITASGVTLDLNGFAITGGGSSAFLNAGIRGDGQSRIRVENGTIVGFDLGLSFAGASQYISLEKLFVDARFVSGGTTVLGLTGVVGHDQAANAIIRKLQGVGQLQLTCPSLITDTIVTFGIVETNIPPNGGGVGFPTNCKGENVIQD